MNIRSPILPLGLAATLVLCSGCMSTGNETLRRESETSVGQKITEGQTTKAEINRWFGSPLRTSFTDAGLEI